jgi:RNA polymerase sigma-70 factor (ECF subfamily)
VTNREPPLTRPTLVGALRQGLRWEEFVALYGRLLLSWGRRDFGLQDSDAENLCQEVLLRVWRGIATFDPARGRFRAWLYACARNAACNLRRGRPGERLGGHGELTAPAPAAWPTSGDGGLEAALERLEEEGFFLESLQQAVAAVRDRVQPATWKAFLLFEFFELTAKEIAPLLGMRPVAVNQAVFRVRRLLQQRLTGATVPPSPRKEPGR